jgi:predicted ATP-grasp superfamily ATP-dependent carboligase
MLTSAIVDPFLAEHSQTLSDLAESLRTIIQNCWPRVLEFHGTEILRSTITCWLNVSGDQPQHSNAADPKLVETLRAISMLLIDHCDTQDKSSLADKLDTIIDGEPRLRALFH